MRRIYDEIIKKQLIEDDVMLFLSGPRQVGKTTSSRQSAEMLSNQVIYLNWDVQDHREKILEGQRAVAILAKIEDLSSQKPIIIFDEIHKYFDWKNFLKGFFDEFHHLTRIVVTRSARLDVYKKGGDSLMGRYFSYRMHPLSLGECIGLLYRENEIHPPTPSDSSLLNHLLKFGGFPMPYIKENMRFLTRWQNLRQQQLLQEDIRDMRSLLDLNKLEVLVKMLITQAGSLMTYSNLANKIRVSVDTISRWIEILESFYFCFLIRPWSRNITRSLVKEPKVFLYDWSLIKDPGNRAENFVASHLLKAIQYWNDLGFGEYGLYYLRDLEKREVDFIVTKNDEAWFLVEVKKSDSGGISKSLYHFYEQSQAKHAFQVVIEKPYVHQNCFDYTVPVSVPALTFLSQLV